MKEIKPIVILNAGRSGSQFIVRMLGDINKSVDIKHEFNLLKFKPELVRYNFHKNTKYKDDLIEKFSQFYIQEIIKRRSWIDSSYVLNDKLLIKILVDNFPELRIIHLVRHGELVVSSWYNKLNDEIYEDKAINQLVIALENESNFLPLEKKYFWNIVSKNGVADKNFLKLSQFEKICFHWKTSISTGVESKEFVSERNYIQIRLEDLIANKTVQNQLARFVFDDAKFDSSKINLKPHNINIKKQFFLTKEQKVIFQNICSKELEMLSYQLGDMEKLIY